jgi:uracil phosphoribosyltransferase
MTVTVIVHPLVQHKLSLMRRKETTPAEFRRLMKEVGPMLLYEATRDLPTEVRQIETPVERATVPMLAGREVCLVPILRAGLTLADAMLDALPSALVGHIGLYRDPESFEAIEYYFKVPDDLDPRCVIVVDPMLATGHSADAAVTRLRQAGCRHLKLISLLAAPEGIDTVLARHPDLDIYVASIDTALNHHGYIVPGLGDAGDRLFGTK